MGSLRDGCDHVPLIRSATRGSCLTVPKGVGSSQGGWNLPIGWICSSSIGVFSGGPKAGDGLAGYSTPYFAVAIVIQC